MKNDFYTKIHKQCFTWKRNKNTFDEDLCDEGFLNCSPSLMHTSTQIQYVLESHVYGYTTLYTYIYEIYECMYVFYIT